MFFTALQSEAVAQNYYVHDGETFSVMLTSNNADTRITKVEFSDNNKWYEFSIVDFESLEDSYEGGFAYSIKDGKGKIFIIDYAIGLHCGYLRRWCLRMGSLSQR